MMLEFIVTHWCIGPTTSNLASTPSVMRHLRNSINKHVTLNPCIVRVRTSLLYRITSN